MRTVDMIRESFKNDCPCSKNEKCTSNRYLLVMTEKYSALSIIEGILQEQQSDVRVIFGSSFPKDQEFTQVRFIYFV